MIVKHPPSFHEPLMKYNEISILLIMYLVYIVDDPQLNVMDYPWKALGTVTGFNE